MVHLKRCTEADCDLLYRWANDPNVRAFSFSNHRIEYEEHLKWFSSSIDSKTRYIYICYHHQIPVGQIRLDVKEEEAVIDLSIDKAYRGMGFGTSMLQEIKKEIKRNTLPIHTLIGRVKYDNIPSQKTFEKAGYSKTLKEEFIEYTTRVM